MNLREFIEVGVAKFGTATELARLVGMNANSLRDAKSGRQGLPTYACISLAKLLGVPPMEVIAASELVTEKNDERRALFLRFTEDIEPGDLILTAPTPFPVLHIERVQRGFYRWVLSLASHVFEQDEGASSIEECLNQAFRNLPEDGKAVEIRYCGIGLGTFQAQSLQEAPDLLAERIVEMFSAVMDGIAKHPA